MPSNLHLAPPAKLVGGLLAVPIDIQHLHASVIFDGATSLTTAVAVISFTIGKQDGCPVFDLRQTIDSATLDGMSIAPADMIHHDFGGGIGAEMRLINRVLPANTTHTLQLNYRIGLPQSSAGGSYPPTLNWSTGPRLTYSFGFTDLAPARYLEAWFPSNLVYDQFSIELELQVINTAVPHVLITTGHVTELELNHWRVNFPEKCCSFSPMLEVRAANTVIKQTDNFVLPVSGNNITIRAWKLNTGAADLGNEINRIKVFLAENEVNYGAYPHGDKFTAFFHLGGMEYDGGTTTGTGALKHETFHSWWARGMKPASQPDSWWDEAWTTYFADSGAVSLPFDFTAPPSELCTQNPWSRITPYGAYDHGNRFWKGMSSLLGNANLKNYMREFYDQYKNKLVRTTDMEEYLLCRSGNTQVVDAFHRFVYGFNNPSLAPDLWLKDDTLDTTGNDDWNGRFWDSPDVWIRHNDDGQTIHQAPEYGQDNWFYARVRNKSSSVLVKHFCVAFNAQQYAGTQFSFPTDFLPCVAAASGFNLAPGATMIVKAKWPKAMVPPAGTHACILAAVITRGEHTALLKNVWENNNLAQKNVTIVNLKPDKYMLLPVVIANYAFAQKRAFSLELTRPAKYPAIKVSLLHRQVSLFKGFERATPFRIEDKINAEDAMLAVADMAPFESVITVDSLPLARNNFPSPLQQLFFNDGRTTQLQFPLKNRDQLLTYLKVKLPADIAVGEELRFDLVQRDIKTKKIIGGVALIIHTI